jgi:hypothetical protein
MLPDLRTTKPTYNVYVDETFEHFLNLPRMEGHFCYVGLMVPEKTDIQLRAFWSALERRLRLAYEEATGFAIEEEFKSTFLAKLDPATRRDAMQRVAYFLGKNVGFIAGFYTTVHGLMCWELRSAAGFADFETLPPYNLSDLQAKAEELRSEKKKGVGESKLLEGLFHTIPSIPLSWLGLMPANFRISYDARNPKEDRILFRLIEDFFPRMANVEPDRFAGYLGAQAHSDSSTVPGIMLADLVCKELRNFVQACPEILTDRSEYRLITPTSAEGTPIPTTVAGHVLKWGSAKAMSAATQARINALRRTGPFGPLIPTLADTKLSCYAHFGEGRVVDFAHHLLNDQVD